MHRSQPLRRACPARALRGARPLPDPLPLHTGRAPRNARGAHARPRRAGTVRGGDLARDRLRALAEALARSRIDGWLLRTDDLVLPRRQYCLNSGERVERRRRAGRGANPRERADELSALPRGWLGTRSASNRAPSRSRNPCRVAPRLHRLLGTLRARDRTGGARSDDSWAPRWSTRSSSRARARRSAASSVRSRSCPPSTSAYSRHGRRCVARASNPTRSTRRSWVTRASGQRPNTGRQVSVRAGVPVEDSPYNVNIACGSG